MATGDPDLIVTNSTALGLCAVSVVALNRWLGVRIKRTGDALAAYSARRAALACRPRLGSVQSLFVPLICGLALPNALVTYWVADKTAYILMDNMGYDTIVGCLHALATAAFLLTLLLALCMSPGAVTGATAVGDLASNHSDRPTCHVCNALIAVRSHHATFPRVDQCVPRYDHVSGWINNVVGAGNHRAYVLFLVAWLCHSLLSVILATCGIEAVWRHTTYRIPAEFTYGWSTDAVALIVSAVSLVYTCRVVAEQWDQAARNETAYERDHEEAVWWWRRAGDGGGGDGRAVRRVNPYSLGSRKANLREFFGLSEPDAQQWATQHLFSVPQRGGGGEA